MLCQVVFFRNLGGFFVRDVRAKKFAVSERGKDALDGEDLFFFRHLFCFNFHTSSIAAKREERKVYFRKSFFTEGSLIRLREPALEQEVLLKSTFVSSQTPQRTFDCQ